MVDRQPVAAETYGVDRLFHYPEIVDLLHRKEIQVISGIRRCGKTTILKQCMRYLMDQGVPVTRVLYIPCDDPLLNIRTYRDLHQQIARRLGHERLYVFLDEIQAVPRWETYLKGRYDAGINAKFVISGSTASFFARDMASRLTGRYFFHHVTTLHYVEYRRFKPAGTLTEYLEWGGFPEVVRATSTGEKAALLRSYLDTIIERDIIERCDIRNRAVAKDFFLSIISVVGGKINAERLAKQFMINRRSVTRYLRVAADAFLIVMVPFFSTSRRKNRHMLEKAYPCDIGFTRLLAKRFEAGRAAEWAVQHVIGAASYWSNDEAEVDFITDTLALQVTFTEQVSDREQRALAMLKRIAPRRALVVAKRTTDRTIGIEEFLTGGAA